MTPEKIAAKALQYVKRSAKPGVSTAALDKIAEAYIRSQRATPSFRGYRGYPATICISVNHEVVHGIPKADRFLHEGDVVSVDVGAFRKGRHGDTATTFVVGENGDPKVNELLYHTELALYNGILELQPGKRISDVTRIIEDTIRRGGFQIPEGLGGHRVGRDLHMPPFVPNRRADLEEDYVFQKGDVFAVEPIAIIGDPELVLCEDNWTIETKDRSIAAHFEHTVRIGPEVLTK